MINESMISILLAEINKELSSVKNRKSFDFNRGHLGCAYLAGSLLEIDDSHPWNDILVTHLEAIFNSLSRERYPHPGMLGGLASLAFLLRNLGGQTGNYQSACVKLEQRLAAHMENQMSELRAAVGANRFTYDYALGLAGILYHFECFPSADPIVNSISGSARDFFLDRCSSPHLNELWTSPVDLPDDILESDPKTTFGILDLGQAHGIIGVMTSLLAGGLSQMDEAIVHLMNLITAAIDSTLSGTIPYYICLQPGGMGPEAQTMSGPEARDGWCYGTPILEPLTVKYELTIPDSWTNSFNSLHSQYPIIGQYFEPGLCHGIAGRIALRYIAEQTIPERWSDIAGHMLGSEREPSRWGFWDEWGGLMVVEIARLRGLPLPSPLRVLGVEGDRE